MRKKLSSTLVIFAALSAVSWAQTKAPAPVTPASLQVSGSVKVNAQAVGQANGTVFAGDRIETGTTGAARVALPGLALSMDANSCVIYRANEIEVCGCSRLEVTASRPMLIALQHDAVKLNSSATSSEFSLDNRGRDLRIENRTGVLNLEHGAKVLAELSGQSTKSFAGLGCSAAAIRHTEEAAAAGGAAAAIAASVLSESSHRPSISAVKPQ